MIHSSMNILSWYSKGEFGTSQSSWIGLLPSSHSRLPSYWPVPGHRWASPQKPVANLTLWTSSGLQTKHYKISSLLSSQNPQTPYSRKNHPHMSPPIWPISAGQSPPQQLLPVVAKLKRVRRTLPSTGAQLWTCCPCHKLDCHLVGRSVQPKVSGRSIQSNACKSHIYHVYHITYVNTCIKPFNNQWSIDCRSVGANRKQSEKSLRAGSRRPKRK